jgi:hypothetical protein
VTATLRSDAGATVQRFLDLNFVYLPGSGLSTEIAATAPEFQELLGVIDEYLEPTGIRVGRITHRNLPRPGFSLISTWDEAARLFASSATVGQPRALNVYCNAGFEWPLIPAVGLSGGIPGPAFNGTGDSGILVRTWPLFTCNACLPAFGSLFAHEIGHYLGLYHTTAANLKTEDPFADTPRCHAPDLRACPDWNHVMFPVLHYDNRVWSPGQIEVVRTHPLVYTAAVVRPVRTTSIDDGAVRAAPNPFRGSVRLDLQAAAVATVSVHDVAGRRVRTLAVHDGAVVWDGRDERGADAPSDIYFLRPARPDAPVNRVIKLR